MRRPTLALTLAILLSLELQGQNRPSATPGEWRHYAGNALSQKYSPLDQITKANVSQLKIFWRWTSPDNAIVSANPLFRPGGYQDTPLIVNGVLYTVTSLGQVAALDKSRVCSSRARVLDRWQSRTAVHGHRRCLSARH